MRIRAVHATLCHPARAQANAQLVRVQRHVESLRHCRSDVARVVYEQAALDAVHVHLECVVVDRAVVLILRVPLESRVEVSGGKEQIALVVVGHLHVPRE